MFIGHYAPALVAATSRRSPPLGGLFVAAQLVDIAFFSLFLLGVEKMRELPGATAMNGMDLYSMPFTHSLAGAIGWAAAFAVAVRLTGRDWTAGAIGGAVVVSHWLIDLIVHRPDLTLAGTPPLLGFGLWNHPAIEMPLELGITFAALGWYVARTRPLGGAGRWSPWALAAGMAALQAVNWATPQPDAPGPAPASAGWLALIAYAILTGLAWWVAHTRRLA